MPLTPSEIAGLFRNTPQPDYGLVPAAFADLSRTILAKRELAQRMAQDQQQFDASLAQRQNEFDVTEGRAWHDQAAREGVGYARIEEQRRAAMATGEAKRREAQAAAAKAVGEALSTGRADVVETMRPYLQSLGVTAEVAEAPPQLQAFTQPGVDMSFGLGRRSLRLTADGQSLGEVDLDRIEEQHRAGAEGIISNLIAGAPEMDRAAYQTMGDAARSSPEMMAAPGMELFKTLTSAADAAAGQLHTDRNAELGRDAAMANAGAARAGVEGRADRAYEAMAVKTANSIRDKRVAEAMQISSGKKLVESERAATNGVSKLDAAIKAGATLEGSAQARLAVGEIVRGLYGAASSNQELKTIWQMSFGSDAENKFNYFTGGGAIDRDQLNALRNVLHQSLMHVRQQRLAVAQSARDNILHDASIGYFASGGAIAPDFAQELANSGARSILGMGVDAAPVQPGEVQDQGMDGALEQEAEQAEEEDPDMESALQGWGL